MKQAAVFLDRDGTLIEDLHYPREPDKVQLIPGTADGLWLLQEKGYWLFVISNQSGINRGIIAEREFKAVHERFMALMEAEKIDIKASRYCPHRPDEGCLCRKPSTGNVPKNFSQIELDWKQSFVIGDRLSDLQLGMNMEAQSILVRLGKGKATEESLASTNTLAKIQIRQNLEEAAQFIPRV